MKVLKLLLEILLMQAGMIFVLFPMLIVAGDADRREEEILRRKHEQQQKENQSISRTEPEPTGHEGQNPGGVGQRYSDI